MSFFHFFFSLMPSVFSNVLAWCERLFIGVGVSFLVLIIFVVGVNAIVNVFAPVVGPFSGGGGYHKGFKVRLPRFRSNVKEFNGRPRTDPNGTRHNMGVYFRR